MKLRQISRSATVTTAVTTLPLSQLAVGSTLFCISGFRILRNSLIHARGRTDVDYARRRRAWCAHETWHAELERGVTVWYLYSSIFIRVNVIKRPKLRLLDQRGTSQHPGFDPDPGSAHTQQSALLQFRWSTRNSLKHWSYAGQVDTDGCSRCHLQYFSGSVLYFAMVKMMSRPTWNNWPTWVGFYWTVAK